MALERIPLNERVKILWLLPTASILFILFLVSLAVFFLVPDFTLLGMSHSSYIYVVFVSLLVLGGISYAWIEMIYRNFTYEFGEREMIIRQGVITRKTTVIPYAAIQDISCERSLTERLLELATLEIETAGSSHLGSQTDLPGIANKDAVISKIMVYVDKAKRTAGVENHLAASPSEQLFSSMLSELQKISSKLDALAKAPAQNGSKVKNDKKGSMYDEYESFKSK